MQEQMRATGCAENAFSWLHVDCFLRCCLQCGSCWAFAAAAAVESKLAIKYGLIADLSEQLLVDCADNSSYGGNWKGCDGGAPEFAFKYMQNGPMTTESYYRYATMRWGHGWCPWLGQASLTGKGRCRM